MKSSAVTNKQVKKWLKTLEGKKYWSAKSAKTKACLKEFIEKLP